MTAVPPGQSDAPSEASVERDDGLAEERTELAWTRSGLALLGVFAILARRVWSSGVRPADSLLVVLFALATLGWAIGILGRRRSYHAGEAARPRSPRQLLAVALGTTAVAVAGLFASIVNF
jgi:uncharacterized membrane protein YidH (DUF202 family)